MKIKEMSREIRPREKAIQYGLESLSDLEVVALLLQSGNKEKSVFELADEIMERTGHLKDLLTLRVQDLTDIKGIKEVKALQLLAGVELAKRALRQKSYQASIVSCEDLVQWFNMEIGICRQEHFVAVYTDIKGKILQHTVLTIGTLSESLVHPRDIFFEAIRINAYSLFLLHNHPSGNPEPSTADLEVTERVKQCGILLGIPLVDHIIIGKGAWFSMKQHQFLDC